ncbi:P-loop containing nucleoside triphosphate hydrolase protein [Pyronema domesticum]|uniref:RNA helicase n=1 Tax=Pyronema omphalodes (strain CBS 100304) TaxID=1076935 RepID=U4LQJ7_PYROM|nr:P-loop containing nucleoside triphosphate hydrolase protein [Pyronema domesticum]CCX31615.1 Similar to ATP-dependent RNA helicase DHX29; acc. no. Q7Z478 [Pyronema omphalodes CBS 100304]
MAGKKKKAPVNNRGFATTSTPSKVAVAAAEAPAPEPVPEPLEPPAPAEPTWEPPQESELQDLVTKYTIKVRRETSKIITKHETEKRTARPACYPLKTERMLFWRREGEEESVGDKILRVARKEYQEATKLKGGEPDLITAWMVNRVLIGLGFEGKQVDDAVRGVMTRLGGAKDIDQVVEECLEWGAMFWEEETGRFGEVRKQKFESEKTTPVSSGVNTPIRREPVVKDMRHLQTATKKLEATPTATPKATPHDTLVAEISNLGLETKDISDRGSDPALSEDEESGEEEESDKELTPENLVPMYLALQTKLFKIHPNCASTIVGGKKIKGGGKKPTKSPPQPPPKSLSDKDRSTAKRLQMKLAELERDPLFDSYIADTAWRDERQKLHDLNLEIKKASGTAPAPKPSPRPPPKSKPAEDEGMMGMLFDGPPTEESGDAGENIVIRDFEEAPASTTTSAFPKKVTKGKAGVGAPAMRKLMEEICKSRDVNSKVRFEAIGGTTFSNRSRLIVTWSQPLDLKPTEPGEEPDVVCMLPEENKTVFEMKKLAAATHDQADGFIATYALHKLFAKKEDKLYLRLPTVWRNVWGELVADEKGRVEKEEVKLLEGLRELLKVDPATAVATTPKTASPPTSDAEGTEEADGEQRKKPKASYEQYLEGEDIKEAWQLRRSSPAFLTMEAQRQNLPMWAFRGQVLRAVEANPVVVLSGETGCGKSTQLPAFLMEHELENGRPCKIYCTQPRRISAVSLARRVAEEMGEGKNKVGGLVGYSIRLENMVTDQTRLVYATTGIVMRMLERSTELNDITHLILDEVHERTIESDFLMVVLKRLLVKRKNLKVVLMSATVDAEKFSDYLGGAPVLKVPGRTFPVQEFFLEDAIEATGFVAEEDSRNSRYRKKDWDDEEVDIEVEGSSNSIGGNLQGYLPSTRANLQKLDEYRIPYDLILELLVKIATAPEYIDYSSAILVFLPGMGEIRRLNDMILGHPMFGNHGRRNNGGWLVYPLHSTIASEEQEAAFLIPPHGMRKIVLATNIAETGITIPDVTAVIDTGKHKEMRFDEKRQLSRLIETFVSRANAKQRRGRAGRVQPGICWHLFTRERHDKFMADQQTPEIMRLSLQDLVLRVKICALGNVEEVLTSALDSPTPKNIRRAVDSLVDVKALTSDEELTPLGRQLAKLPLDVYLGKLVLLGSLFSCLDAALTMAALLSSKSPFVSPGGYGNEAERAKLSFERGGSDLLTIYNAYATWRRVCMNKGTVGITEAEFCRRNYISQRTMSGIEDLKGQLTAAVVDAGFLILSKEEKQQLNRARYQSYRRTNFFIVPEQYNKNQGNDAVVNASIAAAFYPKLLAKDGKGWRNVGSGKTVKVAGGSVNKETDSEWLSYYGIMQTGGGRKTYDAHDTGHVDEVAIAVLCGDVEWKMFPGTCSIDGNRIKFAFPDWRGLMAVRMLRKRISEILRACWKNPEKELSEQQKVWVQIFWEAMDGVTKAREKRT